MRKERVWLTLSFLGMSCSAFITLLLRIDKTTDHDWNQFDSLSSIIRSSILHYKTLPIHDPWYCGGLDLLTNPQNRIFSPMVILDILFTPHLANTLSLVCYGAFGSLGMYLLLKRFAVGNTLSLLGAFIWVHSSYLGLHYLEGHILRKLSVISLYYTFCHKFRRTALPTSAFFSSSALSP